MGLRRWLTKKLEKKTNKQLVELRSQNIELNKKIGDLINRLNIAPPKEKTYIEKIYNEYNISLLVELAYNVHVDGEVEIGDYTYIRKNSLIRNVSIGKYCAIATNVNISPINHPTNWLSIHHFQPNSINSINKVKTTIGNDVWIGANSIIMPGTIIGNGAVIGANAVVTKDVPPYAVVAGVPAKIIKYRFDESTIKELLELKWWELDKNELLKANVDFNYIHKAIEQIKQINKGKIA